MKSQIFSLACLLLWTCSLASEMTVSRTVNYLDSSVFSGNVYIQGCSSLDELGCSSISLNTPKKVTVLATGELYTDMASDTIVSVSGISTLVSLPVPFSFECQLCGSDCVIENPFSVLGLPGPIVIPTSPCPIKAEPIDFIGIFEVPNVRLTAYGFNATATISNSKGTVFEVFFDGSIN